MPSVIPRSTARIGGHPLLRLLVSFPIAYFTGALATDIVYTLTADMMWSDFSAWLLAAGVLMGGLAALVGLIDLVAVRRGRSARPTSVLVLGSLVVLAVGTLNSFIHSRDAWTAVVPEGLALSAFTVLVILLTAWFGSERAHLRVDAPPLEAAQ